MLDTDTKRRIDTARDILVGKVPDPKSQVEQITIALIYKFMDDMDAGSEDMGGDRKFFTGEFARYGWQKLMHSGLGGHETLALYAEGIDKMPKNPGIPALFRDIFKNAYLPYRDPETLRAFLKIIDEFSYDHSERLGDAFEYLLSVLGSQGDAGQFRTPRHIIDFMVEVLKPQKHEVILDPACGTAGFLISAYKHILRNNVDAKGKSTLTPDDRAGLAVNFKGYDISPDMVRLSLVNLYLHGFTDPHIYEYDTLTQEDRWNELADVILANPPFMSPKGGIKPHKRFSIDAKRSEVLFVDYMAEHLTANGRAGIIVPEGIIFQSQTAYKALRKMLVDEALVAVVSLPAGCFNPYSGVKTSILILDKAIAKKSKTIAFFKVENDGFGLGAQRREIEKNDLPQVTLEIEAYLQALRDSAATDALVFSTGHVVLKEKIAKNGDYNLSADRYREAVVHSSVFPMKSLGSLVETVTPPAKIQKTAFGTTGRYPIIDQSQDDIAGWTDDEAVVIFPEKPLVIFGDHTCAIKLIETPFAQGADGIKILRSKDELLPKFIFQLLRARPLESDGYQRHYSKLKEYKIPVPPLGVQKDTVAEIEGYQKVIDGARAVLDHYRPHIPVQSEWPEMPLGEVCRFIDYRGKTPEKKASGLPLITAKNVREGFINPEPREYIAEEDYDAWMTRGIPQVGDVLFTMEAPLGNVAEITMTGRFALAQRLVALCPNREILIGAFLKDMLLTKSLQEKIIANQSGTTVYGIKASVLKEICVPVPPISTQQEIVSEIKAEQALVAANRELIARFEKKIQATLARIWGDEPPATSEL
jgi:type I restriction enzyme M protein